MDGIFPQQLLAGRVACLYTAAFAGGADDLPLGFGLTSRNTMQRGLSFV